MGSRAPYDSQNQSAAWEQLTQRIAILHNSPLTTDALQSEASPKFLQLMLAAMLVSYHKYGALMDAYPERVNALGTPDSVEALYLDKPWNAPSYFDLLGSFGKRMRWYFYGEANPDRDEPGEPHYLIEPGNAEYLVDAANFLMIEFMHPAHPNAHYAATDKEGSPGRVATNVVYEGKGVQYKNTDLLTSEET
jgi:hypothetical protein